MEDENQNSLSQNDRQGSFDFMNNVPGTFEAIQGQITAVMLQGCSTDAPPDNAPELIAKLLELYKVCKKRLSSIVPIYENFVLCNILNFCYLWKIADTSLVADVLGCYYVLHGNFDKIFKIGGGLTCSKWSFNSDVKSLEFFLKHANDGRLLFHGRRFVDVTMGLSFRDLPIDYAIETINPDLILLLFRYGASLRTFEEHPFGVNEVKAITFLLDYVWSYGILHGGIQVDENVMQCLRVVLRTIRKSQPERSRWLRSYFSFSCSEILFEDRRWSDFIEVMCSNVPRIKIRFGELSDLKQLCRCTIREALNRNWCLPAAIENLPIPRTLKTYLDLMHD